MSQNISYTILGGNPIIGEIQCMGAKNLATKTMVAALLSDEPSYLHNVPHIGDIEMTERLINSSGVKTEWIENNTLKIDPGTLKIHSVSMPDSRTNRIPILLLSILLHRCGKAEVPTVGGDSIGYRKVNFHIDAIRKFGGVVKEENHKYIAYSNGRLKACHIHLEYPSVGATETSLFLAVLAEGTSVIHNVAEEPEIQALVTMLQSMGAIIFMTSSRTLVIQGVDKLSGANMYLIGDRIEVASWASLACASNGRIKVSGVKPESLGNFLSYYNLVGGGYHFTDENTIEFFRAKDLRHVVIETDVYPGFSTDWQQPFTALLTQASGVSIIHETVYEDRFGYLEIFNKLGAKTQIVTQCLGSVECRYKGHNYPHSAIISGPTELKAIDEAINVPDIRAGLAYLIAAVMANGKTTLTNAQQIERGYGNLMVKLRNTNINIQRSIL